MAAHTVVDTGSQRRSNGPVEGGRDRISLTGISAFGHHGVYDFERQQGQQFVVDVSCTLDLSSAASTDDLAETIDYGALAQAITADVERDPLNLIEALADRIALTCLRYDAVQCVEVTVHKPQAPMPVDVADVTVTLTRSRTT
ncbi:MAG TPA: dihydroneopterin aldolase [Propionibacteriaceae bacterium]|nr:dihydroneopterin aldolase [Propionibacteriaceae bacterium]